MLTKVTKEGLDFFVRDIETSWDHQIIAEMTGKRSYMSLMNLQPTDIVLDAGGYIGTFACQAAKQVKRVLSFEPEPTNAQLFLKNVSLNNIKNVSLVQKAVVSDNDLTKSFYVSTKKSTAGHSLRHCRGRTEIVVECINFDTILATVPCTAVKIDIEGEEFNIFKRCKAWKNVEELMFEWHFLPLQDVDCDMYYATIEYMQRFFAHVCYYPAKPGAWISTVHCSNREVIHD